MRRHLTRAFALALATFTALQAAEPAAQQPWPSKLFIGGGGAWQQRLPLDIRNRTDEALAGARKELTIQAGSPLIGEKAGTLRIVDEQGRQLKYRVVDAAGRTIQDEAITAGCIIFLPVTLPANGSARYHIYFGNPRAWSSPDLLSGIRNLTGPNGDFERLDQGFPAGWRQEMTDATHRISLSTEKPASGKHCIKAEIRGKTNPSWFRCANATAFSVVPGANVSIRVMVRGENVSGKVGWFVHCGNLSNRTMYNHVAEVKQATFDWQEIAIDFTVPEGATSVTTGSVLFADQGTAWYDDFSFKTDRAPNTQLDFTPGPVEQRQAPTPFSSQHHVWRDGFAYRLPLQLSNPTGEHRADVLTCFDIALLGNKSQKQALLVEGDTVIKTFAIGSCIFFRTSLPPHSTKTFHVYTNAKKPSEYEPLKAATHAIASDIPSDQILVEKGTYGDIGEFASLLSQPCNLMLNPSFEETDEAGQPVAWQGSGERLNADNVTYGLASPGGFGKRHAFVNVPDTAPKDWVGWRQRVPVKPDTQYVYGAWLSGKDLDTAVTVHAHLRNAAGKVVSGGYLDLSQAPLKETSWSPCFGTVHTPEDTAFFEMHLTMNGHGLVKHDGTFLAEVCELQPGVLETRPIPEGQLALWQVDPIVKVFAEDAAETRPVAGEPLYGRALADLRQNRLTHVAPFGIELARQEQEPFQLALRAGSDTAPLTVSVSGLEGTGLSCDIGVVGYVPVDWKSSYFSSRMDDWYQLIPHGEGGSDGWSGLWPDPIRPENTFALKANTTQPLWLLFRSAANARPGLHHLVVTIADDRGLKLQLPVSVRVWDFALPEHTTFPAIYDLRVGHRWNRPGVNGGQLRRELYELMKDRKLCPDSVGASPVFKREKDGTITADFTAYDQAAEIYYNELKFPMAYTPGFFYLFGWAHPPKNVLGEKPFDGDFPWDKGEARDTLRPEYVKAYQTALRLFMDHMRNKGWDKKVVLYISDEPHYSRPYIRNQMKALCKMIKDVEPDLPIYSSTWGHCQDWDGYISLWGAGHYGRFPEKEITQRQQAGDQFWFTTDGQMCTDTPYAGIERLLPYYCFKYGATAYEFWGATWLTHDPWKYGWHAYIRQSDSPTQKPYWIRYPNGDGYIIYPGHQFPGGKPVPSIRMEGARDGVEDYECFDLLKQANTPEAQTLLDDVRSLVSMPSAGGRYTSRFISDPAKIRAVRFKVSRYLETLRPGK